MTTGTLTVPSKRKIYPKTKTTMKLTPEQKAFYEYGKAVATLESRIERIRNNARIRFKMEYHELPLQFRGGLWDDFKLYNVIGDVRQKRAACRLWNIPNHERICGNCKFWDCLVDEHPCSDCNSHHHNKWEPREKK